MKRTLMFAVIALLLIATVPVLAHEGDVTIPAEADETVEAAFDIVYARVTRFGSTLIFHQVVRGEAGSVIPDATGEVAGADVYSYVWLTSLDSSAVGFDAEQGILALAVTSHPDFDDTPLWDEDGDGDPANDGAGWHSHWVVLVADNTCGEGGLKVRDIEADESPTLPDTWPQLPLLIASPNYGLELTGNEVVVSVPRADVGNAATFNFDGVTAGLRVNANLHNPFLCVSGVNDVASGDLSLPGVAN